VADGQTFAAIFFSTKQTQPLKIYCDLLIAASSMLIGAARLLPVKFGRIFLRAGVLMTIIMVQFGCDRRFCEMMALCENEI
jgi:hypothetical protein